MTLAIASPTELGFCPERSATLIRVLQAEIDKKRLPGTVVLIVRHGKIALCESLGMQDPGVGKAMEPDSIFRLYSMTKPIVSVAAMMLMEQGRFLLSDPVAQYLPEFANQQVAVERDGQVVLQPVA